MTKTQLQTLSDTKIADSPIIIPSAHRAANDGIIDELYPDASEVTQDTNVTTHKITVRAGLTGIAYLITLWKQGRTININGVLTVTGSPTAQIMADITDSDFLPLIDAYLPISGIGPAVNIDANTNTIRTSGTLTAGSHTFNGTYACLN